MTRAAERELRHIVRRSESGYITAIEAAEQAFALGYLAIGTAIPKEVYFPGIVMTARTGEELGVWHPMLTNERGGTIPVVMAGRVAKLAVWAAFGGDANETMQRQCRGCSLLPEGRIYDLGTHGWRYRKEVDNFELHGHPDLVNVGWRGLAGAKLGAIDFVSDDGNFKIAVPDEPGQFGSTTWHETVATIPVCYGDVQAELSNVLTALHNYAPLSGE